MLKKTCFYSAVRDTLKHIRDLMWFSCIETFGFGVCQKIYFKVEPLKGRKMRRETLLRLF